MVSLGINKVDWGHMDLEIGVKKGFFKQIWSKSYDNRDKKGPWHNWSESHFDNRYLELF